VNPTILRAEFPKTDDIPSAADAPLIGLVPSIPRTWLESGTAVLDASGKLLDVNEPLSTWLARARAELLGESFWELLGHLCAEWRPVLEKLARSASSFDRANLKLSYGEPFAGPPQWFVLEVARGGNACFVRLNSTLPPLAELEEAFWDEHLRSDSARREMFVRLLRAEARLDGLMRRWPCVIFSQRPDFSVQFISPNIEELTGITVAECIDQPQWFWRLVHELDAGELEQQFKRCVQGRADVTNTYRIRHAVTGRVAYILEHRQPAISQNGLLLGYEVVWLDVTRQTIAEKRLSTAAWKETLAVLTLGMAHDFTNIIAGIHSLSESFLSDCAADHPFREGLGLIKKSSLQASQLVQRMVNLHVGQTGERNYHNLNDVTSDLVELVKKILPRRIQTDTELSPAPLAVYLDVVEFRQVVINLILNAADAMPRGGELTLRTSRHEAAPAVENLRGAFPRLPCVCLTIEDTGSGIKPRHLATIFDPFFTTKAKGSGLGLYNARIAIEKHQGAISVTSKEGLGTSFHLWLPEADFSESKQADDEARRNRRARRCLLLLGQPGDMREKKAELLRSHDFHVVVGSSTDDFTELLDSPDYQFSGVFLLVENNDPALASLPGDVRQQKKDIKIVVQLAGCNQDDMDGRLLNKVDLLLHSDLPEADMLQRLQSLFDQPA
jgi:PAS domain S-box-containing protein